eukprot:6079311-Amphidinium_carterae.1
MTWLPPAPGTVDSGLGPSQPTTTLHKMRKTPTKAAAKEIALTLQTTEHIVHTYRVLMSLRMWQSKVMISDPCRRFMKAAARPLGQLSSVGRGDRHN